MKKRDFNRALFKVVRELYRQRAEIDYKIFVKNYELEKLEKAVKPPLHLPGKCGLCKEKGHWRTTCPMRKFK